MTLKPDIDPKNGKIDEPIALRGEPEFLAADRTGKAYINLMTTNEVAVVDLKSRKVVANWPVAPGGSPVGMAIDTAKGLLFIGCRDPQKLIVMSTKDGKVISDMPIGPSVDAIKVDGNQAFASTSGSQLYVAGETPSGKYQIVQTVTTGEGARTMGIDVASHRLYLPSADYETGPSGRRSQKSGTFKLIVVGR
jgi:DNA-binding beta-propeller fold protein YncE